MRDVVFGVMTSRRGGERRRWIGASWGAGAERVYYSDHRNPFDNVVKVSSATHYKSNEEKHINFLNRCGLYLAERYRWIFCCDDDTFVFRDRLAAFLASGLDRECVYGTVDSFAKCPKNPIFQRVGTDLRFPAGGAGYLISSDVVRRMHPFKNHGTGYSDVSFGLNAEARGVGLVDRDDLFFAQAPEFFGHPADGLPEAISYHYIKSQKQVERLVSAMESTMRSRSDFRIPMAWW